jgi:hypothetical protein
MTPNSRTRSVAGAAAWIAAGAVGATVLTGLAVAAPQSAGTTGASVAAQSADSSEGTARERLRDRLRGFLHGEITVQGADGPITVDLQRGEVTASTPTSVTVRSTDGFTTTYEVTSATTVRRDRGTASAGDLEVGDTAFVRADGTTATAVRAISPEALAQLRDRLAQGGAGQGLRGLLGGTD